MESNIFNYITTNIVLTLATSVDGLPYCANLYYAYDVENHTLIFLSEDSTRHIQEAVRNSNVAGTIQNGVTTVAEIQGIQFVGEFISPSQAQAEKFYAAYYEKFPFAKAKPSPIWGIQLNWIKMTDNTLGFGTKLFWDRSSLTD